MMTIKGLVTILKRHEAYGSDFDADFERVGRRQRL